jgi:hypothetical protein
MPLYQYCIVLIITVLPSVMYVGVCIGFSIDIGVDDDTVAFNIKHH